MMMNKPPAPPTQLLRCCSPPILVRDSSSGSSSSGSANSFTVEEPQLQPHAAAADPKQQHVRFASTSCSYPAAADDDDDVRNSWYSEDDYSAFQKDCRITVTAFVQAQARRQQGETAYHLDGAAFTARGLEDVLSKAQSERRDYRKRLHLHHVLKQQYLQRCDGFWQPEWLQSVSERYSAESCACAAQRGGRRLPY